MKQNLLRISCAAAGLALAAGVFTSCSLLPTPSRPVSHPQQEEEPPKYDASPLRDGRLRLFSSYDSSVGTPSSAATRWCTSPLPARRPIC